MAASAIAKPSMPPSRPSAHAFHQQLARDVAPSRAERRADREFMLAAFHANQQKVGDVGAGYQKHDSDGPHQHPKSF